MSISQFILVAAILLASYAFDAASAAIFSASLRDRSSTPISPQVWFIPFGCAALYSFIADPSFWANSFGIILSARTVHTFGAVYIVVAILSFCFLVRPVARLFDFQLEPPDEPEEHE